MVLNDRVVTLAQTGELDGLNSRTKTLVLLYHYFHPDDVVSARLFSDLARALHQDGWDVVAAPSIRSCHEMQERHRKKERWEGGRIERVWRLALPQASHGGRLFNAFTMLCGWAWRAVTMKRHPGEVMIVGTDPVLGVMVAIAWRFFRPGCTIVHWCHDVYPEAAIADGMFREQSVAMRLLRYFLGIAYRRCDYVADLGSCMRSVLSRYRTSAKLVTLTPWSLVEPDGPVDSDPEVRGELFGTAKLGLLYSGNLGRAHEYEPFLQLARALRSDSVKMCFAGRGPRMAQLEAAVTEEDSNVSLAGFAPEEFLAKRLASADVHLVSLKPEVTGTVVPSKFFGALAIGRPVLYSGSMDSSIAKWIEEYKVGWILDDATLPKIVILLQQIIANRAQLSELNARCWAVYQEHFSRRVQLDRWKQLLNKDN